MREQAQELVLRLARPSQLLDEFILPSIAGFEVGRALSRAAQRGRLGIVGIGERVRMLGGSFEIDSAPGGPTMLTFALPARAQYDSTALAHGLTIVAGGATSNTVSDAGVMINTRSQKIALQVAATCTSSGANATNLYQLVFKRSVDGSSYETAEPFTWNISIPSSTQVIALTNIDVGNAAFLKFDSHKYLSASGTITDPSAC